MRAGATNGAVSSGRLPRLPRLTLPAHRGRAARAPPGRERYGEIGRGCSPAIMTSRFDLESERWHVELTSAVEARLKPMSYAGDYRLSSNGKIRLLCRRCGRGELPIYYPGRWLDVHGWAWCGGTWARRPGHQVRRPRNPEHIGSARGNTRPLRIEVYAGEALGPFRCPRLGCGVLNRVSADRLPGGR